MSDTPTIKVTIVLNGTDRSLYERWGLETNPFPAIPKAEAAAANKVIRDLARPNPDWSDVRRALIGSSQEFIDLCEQHYREGEVVRFDIEFPDPWEQEEEPADG